MRILERYAAPAQGTTIEFSAGGLPLVRAKGLNTNQPVNFSGFTVDTTGNISPNSVTSTSTVTGPTGSFGVLQITSAPATGPTGASAALGVVGAADGGPTTAAQAGWTTVTVGGTKYYVPIWS